MPFAGIERGCSRGGFPRKSGRAGRGRRRDSSDRRARSGEGRGTKAVAFPLIEREGGKRGGAVVEDGVCGGESGEIEHALYFALEGADGEVTAFAGKGAADHEEFAEACAGGVLEAGEVDEEVARGLVVGDFFEDGVEFLPVVGLDAADDFEDGDGTFVSGVVFGHGGEMKVEG